jgi:hypothetical protein
MRKHYTLKDWTEMIFLLLLVIPVWVGISDAFCYTVLGHTWSDLEWTIERVALVFMFFIMRILLATYRKQRIMKGLNND